MSVTFNLDYSTVWTTLVSVAQDEGYAKWRRQHPSYTQLLNFIKTVETFKWLAVYEINLFSLTFNEINCNSIQVIALPFLSDSRNQDFSFHLTAILYLVVLFCFVQIEVVTCCDKKTDLILPCIYTLQKKWWYMNRFIKEGCCPLCAWEGKASSSFTIIYPLPICLPSLRYRELIKEERLRKEESLKWQRFANASLESWEICTS